MNNEIIKNSIFSLVSVFSILILHGLLKYQIKKTGAKHKLSETRYYNLRRILSFAAFMVLLLILILIWGVSIKNLWVTLTGVIAMIAVAFVAVWSLVGNVLAGVIIYFTQPFKINDMITIEPDGITGKVVAIDTFYTIIADGDKNKISIPNSLFFQKYIKRAPR